MAFKEAAIELKNVSHSYENNLSVDFLLKKPKNVIEQPKVNFSKNENVKMIYLNQSKNFPSFYFRQNSSFENDSTVNSNKIDSFSSNFSKNLEKENVSKKFVLKDMNMTIPKGSIYGLLGPSGCGKTTLLKCITGLIKPQKGSVKVFNCDPTSGQGNIPGNDVGYMPQDYSLHHDLTIGEMLYYFGRIFKLDKKLLNYKIDELIKLMDLPDKNQLVSTLSGGQKRRASFVCSIVHMPKLLILDEPTVGCDPLLRERIWNLLVGFSKNNNITIVITTHYIEEAKRSSIVGFMKKGRLMAENTPENLSKNYNTNSLENIFYKLCVTEKKRNLSLTINNSQKSTTANESSSIDNKKNFYFSENQLAPSSNEVMKKNFKEEFKTFFIHLKALCLKQILYTYRKPETAVAQFIVPLIVVMFFCICVGSMPRDIPIGIYNQENCTTNDLCLSEDMITFLNSYAFKKIPYDNFTQAKEDVKKRNLFGILSFGPNFTDAFIDKIQFENSSSILDQSVIKFNGDVTNSILIAIFQNLFYEDYYDFVKYALDKLELKQTYGNLPVKIGEEIFGRYVRKDYSSINAYAGPGLLIIIVYSVSFALTGLSLLVEKSNGVFERNCVAGISTNCMLIAHLIINMLVFAVGLFLLLEITTKVYEIPSRGSFLVGYGILLLQSLTGLANGLILSSLIGSIWGYAIIGNGLLLFIFITSGALWPVESMPFYMNWISYFLPSTLAVESLRCVLVRGMSIKLPIVYHGYLASIAWSTFMIIGASIIFKLKK